MLLSTHKFPCWKGGGLHDSLFIVKAIDRYKVLKRHFYSCFLLLLATGEERDEILSHSGVAECLSQAIVVGEEKGSWQGSPQTLQENEGKNRRVAKVSVLFPVARHFYKLLEFNSSPPLNWSFYNFISFISHMLKHFRLWESHNNRDFLCCLKRCVLNPAGSSMCTGGLLESFTQL